MAKVLSHSQAAPDTAVAMIPSIPVPGDKAINGYAGLTFQNLMHYPFALRQLHPRNSSEAPRLSRSVMSEEEYTQEGRAQSCCLVIVFHDDRAPAAAYDNLQGYKGYVKQPVRRMIGIAHGINMILHGLVRLRQWPYLLSCAEAIPPTGHPRT